MAIPVEASGGISFTPESLLCMGDDAPVFRLKIPSERCVRRFQNMLGDDGLVSYSQADFNAEKVKAIGLYWPDDKAAVYRDQFNSLVAKVSQGMEVTPEELAWADELDDMLYEAHRPLRVMRRKSAEFNEYAPRHAMAVYLSGWEKLDVPFRLEGGVIAEDSISALCKALKKLGESHCGDAPSTPVLELYVAATKQLQMDEEEEKNSPAPSQPGPIPDASMESATTAGASSEESSEDKNSSTSSTRTKTPVGEPQTT